MMASISVSEDVADAFPGLVAPCELVEGVHVGATSGTAEERKRAAAATARAKRTAESLKEDPLFRAYRDFFWGVGIDPTKTRPSGEALNRRVLNGRELPTVNTLVDAYNCASLETGVSLAAYDADVLSGDLVIRRADAGEIFHPIAAEPATLSGGEVVMADDARVVNFYPYRDSHETRITERTTRALLVACPVPGVPEETAKEALERASYYVRDVCGGRAVPTVR